MSNRGDNLQAWSKVCSPCLEDKQHPFWKYSNLSYSRGCKPLLGRCSTQPTSLFKYSWPAFHTEKQDGSQHSLTSVDHFKNLFVLSGIYNCLCTKAFLKTASSQQCTYYISDYKSSWDKHISPSICCPSAAAVAYFLMFIVTQIYSQDID